jgi:hypothetical protein
VPMVIEIDRLSELLLKMADENAPGREFSAAIAELARTGRFANLREVLPGVVYDELWERYQADPIRFIEEWEQLAHEIPGCSRLETATRRHGSRSSGRSIHGRTTCFGRLLLRSFWIWLSRLWLGPRTCASASLPRRLRRTLTAILMKLHGVTSLRCLRRAR